jgi:hypothetical protein
MVICSYTRVEALEQCFEREALDYDNPRRSTVRLST